MQPLFRIVCPILAAAAAGSLFTLPAQARALADKYAPGATDSAERAERAASRPAPVAAPSFDVRDPFATPLFDTDEFGVLWARGRSYKAAFGSEGATFVPKFASDAPRNFPVHFVARGARVAGVEVEFATPARAERDGHVVSLARGACTEQYVVTADAIEQRFVFAELPARGELTVSIDVASELVAVTDERGFLFSNEHGAVRYGRAVAIDARGERVDMESRLVDGRIDLVVPASFVATAALPLVIDPLTSTISVDVDADADWQADVAYDPTSNTFAVVYEEQFSSTDHDVFARKYVDQVLTGIVLVDTTLLDWRNPSVANNALSGSFLCAAQVGASPTRVIRGREFDANSTTIGTSYTISSGETGDLTVPRVGGDPALVGPTYWCVVWERERTDGDLDVYMRLVAPGGVVQGATSFMLMALSGFDDRRPSISKTNGLPPFASQNWNIVWERVPSLGEVEIAGARVLWDGTLTTGPFWMTSTPGLTESNPVASEPLDDTPAGRTWIAAYDIGTSLRFDAHQGALQVGTLDLAGSTFFNLSQPTITTDGRKFPFAYVVTSGLFPSTDVDVRAGTLNYVAGALSYAEVPIDVAASSTTDETRPAIASTFTSTVTNPWRCYVVYDTNDGTDSEVLAGVYDVPLNAGGYIYCDGTSTACPCANGNNASLGISGCANSVTQTGAQLLATGQWAVTADTMRLTVTGMPGTSPCLFFQGTTIALNGTPFGDGLRCAGGTVVRLVVKTAVGGTASYGYPTDVPIHTKGLIPAVGGWRYFQTWYRDSAAFCSASTFNLTNGLAALWTP